ncbi:hypothetical protein Vretifemale_8587, partial [Volvox reticuliferus]
MHFPVFVGSVGQFRDSTRRGPHSASPPSLSDQYRYLLCRQHGSLRASSDDDASDVTVEITSTEDAAGVGAATGAGDDSSRVAINSNAAVAPTIRVGVYWHTSTRTLHLDGDNKASQQLQKQLQNLEFHVTPITSPKSELSVVTDTASSSSTGDDGSGSTGLHVYVVPHAESYTDVEDMGTVAEFLRGGGLVVLTGGATNPQESSIGDFIQKALEYRGGWVSCEALRNNTHAPFGALVRDVRGTLDFLSFKRASAISWVPELEDAENIVAYSRCVHEDAASMSWPLYTVAADGSQVVAQVHAKKEMPGAVLWLGYDWHGGLQRQWGTLLVKIICEIKRCDSGNDKAKAKMPATLLKHDFRIKQRQLEVQAQSSLSPPTPPPSTDSSPPLPPPSVGSSPPPPP